MQPSFGLGRTVNDRQQAMTEHGDGTDGRRGLEFVPVVTLGNLLTLMGVIVPLVVWGVRLESRVDHESELRVRLEGDIKTQNLESQRRNERIEALLEGVRKDVTEIRVSLSAVQNKKIP